MFLIETENLNAGYGTRPVIQGISFGIPRGEVAGIIGPNGAGKTTLFRLIGGTMRPWSGEVRYQGQDVSEMNSRERARRIAVLPQGLPMTFPFTVGDFVMMGRLPHKGRLQPMSEADRKIAEATMKMTEVDSLAGRSITELSGGELQRVFLAQALAQEPELLLLDEPTSHLDIAHQVEIMDLIRRLNREKGLTILMVQHDLNLAGMYCDRLLLIGEGRIRANGAPGEVLTYQNIEAVYKTVVVVRDNPLTGRPHVFLVPKERWARRSESGDKDTLQG
jgi:iron complex transport system ATP-binding protein